MKHKKNKRLLFQARALLPSGARKNEPMRWRHGSEQRGRITAMTAFLLCGAVLFLACGGIVKKEAFKNSTSILAEWMAEISFMDLSGGGTLAEGGTTDSALSEALEGILLPDHSADSTVEKESESLTEALDSVPLSPPPLTLQALYSFDYKAVPKGEKPIVPMDLSLADLGDTYINNSTGLKPNVAALLERKFDSSATLVSLSNRREPKVLILHTHGTEAYSPEGVISYTEDESEIARSDDVEKNVVSVGATLLNALTEAGISAVHCTMMHDQAQYKDSYVRAEQTIRRYLEEYPSIRLVIDLHRDSILKSDGSLVRPVTLTDGEPTAQVMCVVGSDWGGDEYPDWERNLSLALKLRQGLNQENERLCRPVFLKSSTYNQEIAPYSLLLEIGAGGNSLAEAKRAAKKVAEVLAEIVPKL